MVRGSVRASDRERERAVAALRRHYAAGRLETDELEERVTQAYASRWRHELRVLLRDMPFEPPQLDRSRIAAGVDRAQRTVLHLHLVCWVMLNVFVLAVWAWGNAHGVFPAVVFIPTTLLLLWHARGSRALSRRLNSPDAPRGALPHRRALVRSQPGRHGRSARRTLSRAG